MPTAGAVIVPATKDVEKVLLEKLALLEGASVQGVGTKGIALVLEAPALERLEEVSEQINEWDEVIDVHLAYLNWEDSTGAR